MDTTSLTSNGRPTRGQIRRVRNLAWEAVEETLECKFPFTYGQLQVVHTACGKFKAKFSVAFREFVFAFALKEAGFFTTVAAQKTGHVPPGWTVKSDSLEGEINLNNLDYSSCALCEGDELVDGATMLERAGDAYGSLGFASVLLEAQGEGKEIFPVESRGKHYFLMPRTILLNENEKPFVACFLWGGKDWNLYYSPLSSDFGDSDRFVRPRQH